MESSFKKRVYKKFRWPDVDSPISYFPYSNKGENATYILENNDVIVDVN